MDEKQVGLTDTFQAETAVSQTGETPAAESAVQPENKKNSPLKEALSWILTIVLGVAMALFLTQVVIVNAKVPSASMEETVMTGDRLIGNRLAYVTKDPERFDIIFFKYPDDESRIFIKRIIGLPGETVEVRDGKVYINDEATPLDDSFIREPMQGSFGPYEVPENCYFVMGDNRNDSLDSRFWTNKFVEKDKILGKAMFRYFPFSDIGKIE